MIKAEIIADSINSKGVRLTSFVLEFPRIILAEVNTHRVFSRNSASSRAVPFDKMVEKALENPFVPTKFQKHHKGMQGKEYLSGEQKQIARMLWLQGRDNAVQAARNFYYLSGSTKQLANRMLEPYMWHTAIVSGTDFENFFALRAHEDAEIHFGELAHKALHVYNESKPKLLKKGDWHIPFGDKIDEQKLLVLAKELYGDKNFDIQELKVKVATARCARVSYFNFEGKDDYTADLKLCDRLFGSIPRHCFDGQTEILTQNGFVNVKEISKTTKIAWVDRTSGKFLKFDYPLEVIKNHGEFNTYHWEDVDIDLKVTGGHNLYAHKINTCADRHKELDMKFVVAEAPNSKGSKFKTQGESPCKMIKSTLGSDLCKNYFDHPNQFALGQLCGFFIGDGFLNNDGTKSKIYFKLKRKRKITFLKTVVNNLSGECCESPNGTTFKVAVNTIPDLAVEFLNLFFNKNRKKTINRKLFESSQEFIDGLFDGLKNSDGSLRRKTWVYSTSSEELKDRIIELGCLFGYVFTETKTVHQNPSINTSWRLNCATKKYVLCNDSRKPKSRVKINQENSSFYCVNIDDNVLITRRNNKIILAGNCSPAEHCAKNENNRKYYGNFKGFKQYRKMFSDENLKDERIKSNV